MYSAIIVDFPANRCAFEAELFFRQIGQQRFGPLAEPTNSQRVHITTKTLPNESRCWKCPPMFRSHSGFSVQHSWCPLPGVWWIFKEDFQPWLRLYTIHLQWNPVFSILSALLPYLWEPNLSLVYDYDTSKQRRYHADAQVHTNVETKRNIQNSHVSRTPKKKTRRQLQDEQ